MDSPQVAVDDFFCKDIPDPFQILGLKLLPLSIGRYRRMARHGINFVSESKTTADGKDLLLGVLICSMKCSEWDELSTSGNLTKTVSTWMWKINASPPLVLRGTIGKHLSNTWVGKLWRKHHSFDLFLKMGLFKSYVNEAQKCPKFFVSGGGNNSSNSHWSHNIEIVLMGELNWSHLDIEERPLSKALADYFKHLENQGMIRLASDYDFECIKNNAGGKVMTTAEYENLKKGGQK